MKFSWIEKCHFAWEMQGNWFSNAGPFGLLLFWHILPKNSKIKDV